MLHVGGTVAETVRVEVAVAAEAVDENTSAKRGRKARRRMQGSELGLTLHRSRRGPLERAPLDRRRNVFSCLAPFVAPGRADERPIAPGTPCGAPPEAPCP